MTAGSPAPERTGSPGLVQRLLGFSMLPFLASVLPLIALPIMSRASTGDDWAALGVGMGVGAFAAAVALVGWNLLGTPMVIAAESVAEREQLYARSFYIRGIAVVVVCMIGGVVAAAIAPQVAATAAVFAVATALNAMTLSWYAVAVAAPGLVFWYEVVPRAIATALAIAVVLSTGSVFWYGALLTLSFVAGLIVFHLRVFRRILPAWPGGQQLRDDVADMRAAWGVETMTSLSTNAPVPIAGIVIGTAATVSFSSSDRIYRYGLMAIIAVGNALQGWVLESTAAIRQRRNRIAFAIMAAVAAIGWVVLAILGPFVSGLLFGADKAGDPVVFQFYAIAFVGLTLATPLIRNILVPARRDRQVLLASVAGAATAFIAMIVLGLFWGGAGVAAGFALGETVNLAACAALVLRLRARPHTNPRPMTEEV
ncbi:MAG: hypothetical protein JST33_05560 [Actinobacteria bacterium]|nr:hypothetical protein [Actinomycetota bacterium]